MSSKEQERGAPPALRETSHLWQAREQEQDGRRMKMSNHRQVQEQERSLSAWAVLDLQLVHEQQGGASGAWAKASDFRLTGGQEHWLWQESLQSCKIAGAYSPDNLSRTQITLAVSPQKLVKK